ncbi:tldc domain-containing protein [Stylonychia lemnae]|uniref:Tldc domain-containing protein n=1 Tax=Stylonychia lemnae TaxID=5949 RepID=A0A078BA09_STYLE|nr:tldc domain-containing protein [Stylonychia lemnae]|eukprot:CDW90102.1 tldc domain-containing protein [Stylonychia lemnae]
MQYKDCNDMLICQHCKKFFNLQDRKPFLLSCGDLLCMQCYNNQKDQVQNLQIQCPFDIKHLCPVDQQIIEPMYLIRILQNYDFSCIKCDTHTQENANIYCKKEHQIICSYCWLKDPNETKVIDQAIKNQIKEKSDIFNFLSKSFNEKHQNFVQEEAHLKNDQFLMNQQTTRKIHDLQKLDQIVVVPFNIARCFHNMYLEFRRLVNEQVNNLLRISNNNALLTNKLGNIQKEVKMIYQASRDGYKSIDFHTHCDNKGPTISFILSDYGQVFGGYTSQPWTSPETRQGVKEGESFVFSLTKSTTKFVDCAVFHCKDFQIMMFGKGNKTCICIYNDSNLDSRNFCDMNHKKINQEGSEISQQNKNDYLAGNSRFNVVDLEVYEITF